MMVVYTSGDVLRTQKNVGRDQCVETRRLLNLDRCVGAETRNRSPAVVNLPGYFNHSLLELLSITQQFEMPIIIILMILGGLKSR